MQALLFFSRPVTCRGGGNGIYTNSEDKEWVLAEMHPDVWTKKCDRGLRLLGV
jgi:hypothetical protein